MAYDSPDRDPEIRRRAAWLLGMLALVAALLVLIMVVFLDGGDGEGQVADPTDVPPAPASSSAARTPSDSPSNSPSDEDLPSDSTSTSNESPSSGSTGSGPAPGGDVSCPSDELCGLDSDVGNAIEAVNAYRVDEGEDAVPGTVSDEARKCALSNGSSCSGSFASTQIPLTDGKADGVAAVERVRTRGKLLRDMKSFSVGWAYDPGAKTLYFAVIRQD